MQRKLLPALLAAGWLASASDSAAALCVSPGGSGGCFATIQSAVDAAAVQDTIDVAAGTYAENVVIGPGSRLTIQGAGAGMSIVDGGAAGNGVEVFGPATRVTLSGLTVQNAHRGIVLYDRPRVSLAAVEVAGNHGSGVMAFGGARLTITASTIRNNDGDGVIAYYRSRLRLLSSTVSGNALCGVEGFEAFVQGGLTAPFVLIADSTVSGNGTAGVVGASSRILRCTITENAGIGLGGPYIFGAKPKMGSTILSNNGSDCVEPIRSRGYNFVGTACAANLIGGPPGSDVVGDDPALGPLQDNGGPTPTHAPSAGSPVLEVVNRSCREPDQRGVSRLPPPCDVGAYEAP